MAAQLLAPLAELGRIFTPPQVDLAGYAGREYSWNYFVFRPDLLRQEVYLLASVLVYVVFYWYGSSVNAKKASAWLDAHRALYDAQFARALDGGLTKDGNTDFFVFSTGRRAVTSLHTVFTLRPRHDLAQVVFQFFWRNLYDLAYEPRDDILLDFKLADDFAAPDAIFAIVAKDELATAKSGRWDLTFTKTSDNAALPPTLSVMTEFADVTEAVLKHAAPLLEALKDPSAQRYFRSISITDQPRVHPESVPYPREHRLLLSLTLPPSSDARATQALVSAAFALVDSLERVSHALRADTKSKLKKVREEFVTRVKEEATKEAKEEAAEARAAAKKQAEEERIAGLSASEQAKILERERKRNLRKTQGKVVRK